jgi:hypothetical protein
MARFPSRENDIAVLAEALIAGLSEHTESFPSPPVTTEELNPTITATAATTAGTWLRLLRSKGARLQCLRRSSCPT